MRRGLVWLIGSRLCLVLLFGTSRERHLTRSSSWNFVAPDAEKMRRRLLPRGFTRGLPTHGDAARVHGRAGSRASCGRAPIAQCPRGREALRYKEARKHYPTCQRRACTPILSERAKGEPACARQKRTCLGQPRTLAPTLPRPPGTAAWVTPRLTAQWTVQTRWGGGGYLTMTCP